MKSKLILSVCLVILCLTKVSAQSAAIDYLNVPGPIVFDEVSYELSWSSHPANNFYKQEYVKAGEKVEHFNTMILIDFEIGADIVGLIRAKTSELKKLQKDNPVVHYETFENDGEYMLDFLISENTPNGNIAIVERNVYRYKTITDKGGRKGVLLFGVSQRGYGDDITNFFTVLKKNKNALVNAVGTFPLPAVTVKK